MLFINPISKPIIFVHSLGELEILEAENVNLLYAVYKGQFYDYAKSEFFNREEDIARFINEAKDSIADKLVVVDLVPTICGFCGDFKEYDKEVKACTQCVGVTFATSKQKGDIVDLPVTRPYTNIYCSSCHKSNKVLLLCGACKSVLYCSIACQKTHRRVHSPACKCIAAKIKSGVTK